MPTDEVEPCSGCGRMSIVGAPHPIVGVALDAETNEMAAFPVCGACWRDPAHRTMPLKMHFFPRDQKAVAVERAGKGDIG